MLSCHRFLLLALSVAFQGKFAFGDASTKAAKEKELNDAYNKARLQEGGPQSEELQAIAPHNIDRFMRNRILPHKHQIMVLVHAATPACKKSPSVTYKTLGGP